METLPIPFCLIYSPILNELVLIQYTMFSTIAHIENKTVDYNSLEKIMRKGHPWFPIEEWQSTEEFYGNV